MNNEKSKLHDELIEAEIITKDSLLASIIINFMDTTDARLLRDWLVREGYLNYE